MFYGRICILFSILIVKSKTFTCNILWLIFKLRRHNFYSEYVVFDTVDCIDRKIGMTSSELILLYKFPVQSVYLKNQYICL